MSPASACWGLLSCHALDTHLRSAHQDEGGKSAHSALDTYIQVIGTKISAQGCTGMVGSCLCLAAQQIVAYKEQREHKGTDLSRSTLMCFLSMLYPICLLTTMSDFRASSVGAT